MYAVLNLAMLAAGFGNWKVAIAHLNGLQKIVQMRGNRKFLKERPKLQFKLDRQVESHHEVLSESNSLSQASILYGCPALAKSHSFHVPQSRGTRSGRLQTRCGY